MFQELSTLLSTRALVPIDRCVHFCAYRYGHREPNPYEQYAHGLAANRPLEEIRAEYVGFLSCYRPMTLGQALGAKLSSDYPLWYLPWRKKTQVLSNPGWVPHPEDVMDVMTFFSHGGIPRSLVEREFGWSENAFRAISTFGYQPERFDYITVRELRHGRESTYIVIDGNHRLSALSSLGVKQVLVRKPFGLAVDREAVDRWPLVRNGLMNRDDSLRVFDAYFEGNVHPTQTSKPVNIVSPDTGS